MATRDGMNDVIMRLRGMCAAAEDEYTVFDVTYWTDEQLQDALDAERVDVKREVLTSRPDYGAGGTVTYRDYYFRYADVEGTATGAEAWLVQDGEGNTVAGTAYVVNERARHIRFAADTGGTTNYRLSYRTYDLNRAAAAVWHEKAGHVASRFDLATDNHDMKRSQLYKHYSDRAAFYRQQAGAGVAYKRRRDAETRHAL